MKQRKYLNGDYPHKYATWLIIWSSSQNLYFVLEKGWISLSIHIFGAKNPQYVYKKLIPQSLKNWTIDWASIFGI